MQVVGKSLADQGVRWSRDANGDWTKAPLIDLVCGAEAAGWFLNWGYAVNDDGVIVGRGSTTEGYRAFLLIPVAVPDCVGDLNDDQDVDGVDLAILLGGWGACPSLAEPCLADLNCDGLVDGLDLAILLAAWGECGSSSFMSGSPGLQALIEILETAGLHDLAELLQSIWPQE